jgi:hypothetical protein
MSKESSMKDNLTRRAALGAVGTAGLAALAATVLSPSRAAAEDHPHLHRVKDELEAAKDELEAAKHGFKGHKAAAIDAIKEALHQVNILIDNE